MLPLDDPVDEDPGRVDVVRVELAIGHELLDLGDAHLARRRRHRVEVARGLAVDEVALVIALPRLDDREVADDAALHDVGLAVELAQLLALGDEGADPGLGEEGRDAGAAGADALGQRPLRVELDLDLAGQVLPRELLVLADIGADHLPDHVAVEQLAESPAVDPAIVADHGQPLGPAGHDRVDQVLGDAAQAEAAGDDRHVVEQEPG